MCRSRLSLRSRRSLVLQMILCDRRTSRKRAVLSNTWKVKDASKQQSSGLNSQDRKWNLKKFIGSFVPRDNYKHHSDSGKNIFPGCSTMKYLPQQPVTRESTNRWNNCSGCCLFWNSRDASSTWKKTAYSTCNVPVDINLSETPVCNISNNSNKVEVLRNCGMKACDESTFTHKNSIEAMEMTLRDVSTQL